jgi:hypothetical protein
MSHLQASTSKHHVKRLFRLQDPDIAVLNQPLEAQDKVPTVEAPVEILTVIILTAMMRARRKKPFLVIKEY